MRFEKMLLQRFCQYTNKTIDFSPGMNVVIGPIGSGKSNLLKAMRLLFINSSGNVGNQADDVQKGTDKSERSGISAVGWHGSRRFFFSKNLQPASREFYWEGSTVKLFTEKAISEEIRTQMGIDPGLFDEFIIVPQGELANVLDMTDSQRVEVMQKMAGLQKYAKLHSWLGTYQSKNLVPNLSEDPDSIKAKIAGLVKEREGYIAALSSISRCSKEARDNAEKMVAGYQLSDDLRKKILQKRGEIASMEFSLPQAREIVSSMQAKLESLRASVKETEAHLASLNAEQLSASTQVAKERLIGEIERIEAMAEDPPVPADYIPLESLEKQAWRADNKRLMLLHHFKNIVDAGHKACPTCTRPIDSDFTDQINEIPELEKRCHLFNVREKKSRDYDNDVIRANGWKKIAETNLPALQKTLSEMPETTGDQPTKSRAELNDMVDGTSRDLATLKSNLSLASSNFEKATGLMVADETLLQKANSDLEVLLQQSASLLSVTDEDYAKATKLITDDNEAIGRSAVLDGSIAVVNKQIPVYEKELVKAIAGRERINKIVAFKDAVDVARSVLHQDELPFELGKGSLLATAAEMNETLAAFGAQYRLSAGVGSSFQAMFFNDHNKGVQPDTRLSGGERAQFGLALRIAVNYLSAQELGFLALDEPTYGFGQSDMKCVHTAIERLRSLSNDRGLQVIVVTHEKSLIPLFDNVINLGG